MIELITRAQIHSEIDAGRVTVIDAVGSPNYDKEHLPGAVPLVAADVQANAPTLLPDKDAPIVTYCASAACPNSQRVAEKLIALGYTNVRTYREGIEDWVAAGLPTHSGAKE